MSCNLNNLSILVNPLPGMYIKRLIKCNNFNIYLDFTMQLFRINSFLYIQRWRKLFRYSHIISRVFANILYSVIRHCVHSIPLQIKPGYDDSSDIQCGCVCSYVSLFRIILPFCSRLSYNSFRSHDVASWKVFSCYILSAVFHSLQYWMSNNWQYPLSHVIKVLTAITIASKSDLNNRDY